MNFEDFLDDLGKIDLMLIDEQEVITVDVQFDNADILLIDNSQSFVEEYNQERYINLWM